MRPYGAAVFSADDFSFRSTIWDSYNPACWKPLPFPYFQSIYATDIKPIMSTNRFSYESAIIYSLHDPIYPTL